MKEMLYSLYRKLGGPRDQFGWVRKISHPARVRTPDRPAGGDSLYKVHYPGQQISTTFFIKTRQNYDDNNNNNTKRCVKQRSMPQGSKTEDVWHSLLINYIYITQKTFTLFQLSSFIQTSRILAIMCLWSSDSSVAAVVSG